ncbi:hypothetical protein [Sphingomonas daechungensis]|uniref:hypothetical protein n=1 Tax=Sphingomonas daechungensis TaxID=1176646 RepID=UPI003783F274
MGTKLETIGDLIDGGHTVTGWCNDCGRGSDIDLDAVAARRGRDWSYIRQKWPIRCGACGSGNTSIRIGIAGRPRGPGR